jgi:hypothetical protein
MLELVEGRILGLVGGGREEILVDGRALAKMWRDIHPPPFDACLVSQLPIHPAPLPAVFALADILETC